MRILTAIGLILSCIPLAHAQQGAQPTGRFTPGHALRANTSSGTPYSDAGGAAGSATQNSGYLTELGITAKGLPACINDALTSDPDGYHSLCFGHDNNGNAVIFVNSVGTAGKDLIFDVNGVQIFPGQLGTTLPTVPSTTALAALASTFAPAIARLDTVPGTGAPPLIFRSSTSACTLNAGAGDKGSQVPTSDGKCWIAAFPAGPYDARWWEATYPFHIYVDSSTGVDLNNYGLDAAHPMRTTQAAIKVAHKLDFRQQSNFMILAGTILSPLSYPGFLCDGEFYGAASDSNFTTLNVQSTNGSAAVTITNPGFSGNIIAETGCRLLVQGLTVSTGASQYGIFAERGAYIARGPDMIYNGSASQAAEYTESNGYIQAAGNQKVTVQGTFNTVFQVNGGRIRWDPVGTTGEFSSGTGLTAGTVLSAFNGEILWFVPVISGTGVTGDLIQASGNSVIEAPPTNGAASNSQIPGTGSTRLWQWSNLVGASGGQLYKPNVNTCINGGVLTNASNYAFQVQFNGANSACGVNFTGPTAPAAGYYSQPPVCNVSRIGGAATDSAKMTSITKDSIGIVPSGANFSNGEAVLVTCLPRETG